MKVGIVRDENRVEESFVNSLDLKSLGKQKDFLAIFVEESQKQFYWNGIILSFDEALEIINEIPKYKEIVDQIKKCRNGLVSQYTEEVIFTPYNNEFEVLYKNRRLITDLIPNFKVDPKPLERIKKTIPFYLKHKILFNLFDRYINIIGNITQTKFVSFDFANYGFEYEQVLTFFQTYELFFNIRDIVLYKNIKAVIIKIYISEISQDHLKTAIETLPDFSFTSSKATPYEILGVNEGFTLNELNEALNKKIELVKREFGNNENAKNQINKILDAYLFLKTNTPCELSGEVEKKF